MDPKQFERYIEPPPRLAPVAELLPHLGGLQLAAFQGVLPDEVEEHPVETYEAAFDDDAAARIMNRALELESVRERLGRGRIQPIGVSRRGARQKGESEWYLLVAYDYTANVTVEVHLTEKGELRELREEAYQPAPVAKEIEHAIALARADARLTERVKGLVASTIPYAGPDNEYAARRVLEVVFGCRSERAPRYRAWVDLATERVLHAGAGCECGREQHQEARHE